MPPELENGIELRTHVTVSESSTASTRPLLLQRTNSNTGPEVCRANRPVEPSPASLRRSASDTFVLRPFQLPNAFRERLSQNRRLVSVTLRKQGRKGCVVVSSLVALFFINGLKSLCGIYFSVFLREFRQSESATSWIGALAYSLVYLSGPVASFLIVRYRSRVTTLIGGTLTAVGLFLSGFASSIEQLYFTFGILVGVGLGLCYVSAYAAFDECFRKQRQTAFWQIVSTSISSAGSLVSSATPTLIRFYGWRSSLILLSALSLNLFVCALLMPPAAGRRTKYTPRQASRMSGRHLLYSTTLANAGILRRTFFLFFLAHVFTWSFAIGAVVVVSSEYMRQAGGLTLAQVGLMQAISTGSALLANLVAIPLGRVGQVKFYTLCAILRTPPIFLFPFGSDLRHFAIVWVLSGLTTGLSAPFFSPMLRKLVGQWRCGHACLVRRRRRPSVPLGFCCTKCDVDEVTGALGYTNFSRGIGSLVGPPVFGWIASYSYSLAFATAGAMAAASTLLLVFAALAHALQHRGTLLPWRKEQVETTTSQALNSVAEAAAPDTPTSIIGSLVTAPWMRTSKV